MGPPLSLIQINIAENQSQVDKAKSVLYQQDRILITDYGFTAL